MLSTSPTQPCGRGGTETSQTGLPQGSASHVSAADPCVPPGHKLRAHCRERSLVQPCRQYTRTVLEFVRAPCAATAPTAVPHSGFGTAEAQTANWFVTVVQQPPGKQTRYSRPGTNLWWYHTRASTTNSASSGNRRCWRRVHLCGRGLSQCELAWRFVRFQSTVIQSSDSCRSRCPAGMRDGMTRGFHHATCFWEGGSTSCTRARLLGSRVACNPCAYGAGTVNPEPTTALDAGPDYFAATAAAAARFAAPSARTSSAAAFSLACMGTDSRVVKHGHTQVEVSRRARGEDEHRQQRSTAAQDKRTARRPARRTQTHLQSIHQLARLLDSLRQHIHNLLDLSSQEPSRTSTQTEYTHARTQAHKHAYTHANKRTSTVWTHTGTRQHKEPA